MYKIIKLIILTLSTLSLVVSCASNGTTMPATLRNVFKINTTTANFIDVPADGVMGSLQTDATIGDRYYLIDGSMNPADVSNPVSIFIKNNFMIGAAESRDDPNYIYEIQSFAPGVDRFEIEWLDSQNMVVDSQEIDIAMHRGQRFEDTVSQALPREERPYTITFSDVINGDDLVFKFYGGY